MGSIDKACISGFLCRLCSEMHRTVIHIYGDQGKRLCLVEKINGYLPITISPTDPLPKTICETCLRRVEQHYNLLMRLTRIKEERFRAHEAERKDIEYSSSCSDEEDLPPSANQLRRNGLIVIPSTSSAAAAAAAAASNSTSHTSTTIEETSTPLPTQTDLPANSDSGMELID